VSLPEALQVLTTIRDFVRWGGSEFARRGLSFGHGFDSALDEARYLSLHALALPYDCPDSYLDAVLTLPERETVAELLRLRVETRQPAAYITRESWFCGLRFYVDERVLVPRSPIAELIANHFEPWTDSNRVQRILDLCCGSACIGIAAQYQFMDAEVCVADISADALEVATMNLVEHELDGEITVYQSDLFEAIPPQAFDVIVTNPPYVDAEDMAALSDEFRCEPEIGLAAGVDGLALVDRILECAAGYLNEQGVIFIEVGNSRAAMEQKYDFLPMAWPEFELGGAGVCCIQARDLRQYQSAITAIASQDRLVRTEA
jgi:ribosomal protein L3 glutamine methyltransferase